MGIGNNVEKLSFVIPCYRSEKTIETVVSQIDAVLKASEYASKYIYEIILVNDNSPDDVWSVIDAMCAVRTDVIALSLAKNFGQHAALMAGYHRCSGDYVFTMDDDGQTPAEEIFTLLDKLHEGFDVVYGQYEDRKDNGFRKLGSKANNFMMESIVGKPKHVRLTSFFVARKYVIDEICRYTNPYPYIWGLIIRTTNSIANVTIQHRRRTDGSSGYTLLKLISLWMNGFTAFSVKPLRIATGFGLVVSVIGFLFTIFTIVYKIIYPETAAGYSSMMSAILIIGGVIMILLGMLGEYVGRIYISMNESPQFVVKDMRNVQPNAGESINE
ncbi:MAG: glycosyltransferase family 2 protein [Clostridiales Family XIII bacterium]|jgi:undecaprenyl-phosphate 4-deoxy-4-formamido-L-arabinose transferase|nr:glycosyltransferase family 2 protein [Clostridiales Family XIII bacterium]